MRFLEDIFIEFFIGLFIFGAIIATIIAILSIAAIFAFYILLILAGIAGIGYLFYLIMKYIFKVPVVSEFIKKHRLILILSTPMLIITLFITFTSIYSTIITKKLWH